MVTFLRALLLHVTRLEKIQTIWEEFCNDPQYEPIEHALKASLKNIAKWFRTTDDTPIYFISHGTYCQISLQPPTLTNFNVVLDPAWKDTFLRATWGDERVEAGMKCMQTVVSYFLIFSSHNLIMLY